MPARVRYATTTDGVRIAFAVSGDGLPLMYMPPIPLRHVQPRWLMPEDGAWLIELGRGRTLIQYDPRGLGLSDREALPRSPEDLVRDVEAVVASVGAPRVALLAVTNTGPLAVAYAVRHPDRVSHLILWCASPRAADGFDSRLAALIDVAEKDWDLFTEATAHVIRGWSGGEAARRLAALLRECASPEEARAHMRVAGEFDVTPLLAEVRSPTLVVHRRDLTSVSLERGRELAAGIPAARLEILEGDLLPPSMGDVAAALRAIDEFLGDRAVDPLPPSPEPDALPDTQTFRREGDYWTIAFGGRVCRLRDSKGLHHIARLLREPGRAMAAAELLGATHADLGDSGPVLDAHARSAYRQRLQEARAELEEAERCNDLGVQERLRAEIELVTGELAAAVGLGGKARRAASGAERVRLTVTKRIKDAIAHIRDSHPPLGEHLAVSIRTGHTCIYSPDPGLRISWSL